MDTLQKYRNTLDAIDNEILKLLKKRVETVKKVGEYKKENNLAIVDRAREKSLLENLEKKSYIYGLDFQMVKKIWKVIFQTAYKIEK